MDYIVLILLGLAALVVVSFLANSLVFITKRIKAHFNPTRQRPNASWILLHLVVAALVPLLVLIIIPNLLKTNRPTGQYEAKTNLGAIYVAQLSYFAYHNTYAGGPDVFHLIYWEPSGQNKYAYYCGHDLIPNKIIWRNAYLPMPNRDWPIDTKPASSNSGFTCMAIGNIDSDDTLDVWSINDAKILRNELYDN